MSIIIPWDNMNIGIFIFGIYFDWLQIPKPAALEA